MASSASLKELSKAINTFIVQPSLPLPDSLVATIEAYIDKHEKYDDSVADKLQDELITTFEKHVLGKPEATGPWMGILRRLQWGVQSPQKVLYWFDAAQRILDSTPLEKEVVSETIKAMMNTIAVADKYQDSQVGEPGPNPIIDRLLAIWIEKFYPGVMEDNKAGAHNEKMLREALELFGKKRTKEFFASLDKRFMQKKHRKASLRFLTGFIQCQPPHLYQIAETKFFGHLLTCLQRDTSTTVVSAALTSLIMLMPHMPSSLVPKLPTLFNIYSRLLFWGPERTGTIEVVKSDGDESADWQIAAFDAGTEDVDITHLEPYYTILYGLYPINFTDYIRKPQRYLRHANTSSPDDVEVQPTEIRHRSERFRQTHLLHPNFYTLTIDSEKTDFSRWIKCEAAEVVADCVSLRIGSAADAGPAELPGSPVDGNQSEMCDTAHRDSPEPGLLNSSVNKVHSWRHAQFSSADSVSSDRPGSAALVRRGSHSSQPSTRDATEAKPRSGADSPAPSAHLSQSPSHAHLHDLAKPSKPMKSSLYQSVANDSVASLALSNQESLADKPSTQTSMPPPAMPQSAGSVPPVGDLHTQLAHLQRRISILENDLTFERYLKQQHIAHIGDMRSRHMTEAATEAETQNLILMTRSLRVQYENAKKAEMQVRKEAEKSRSMAKKWEADLSNKLKNLREESKKSTTGHEVVSNELAAAKLECEKLRKLLGEAEVKELTWKQNVQSVEIQREEVERLRVEVARLVQSERDHQVKEREMDSTIAASKDAETQSTEVNMKLKAKEDEVQRAKTMLQSQVRSLREQLSELQEERVRPGANPSLEVENALASSRAKQAELKKEYDLLLRKYKALQSGVLDMESRAAEAARHPRQSDIEPMATPTSPLVARGRLQRVDSLDAPRMSATPSSEPQTPSLSRKTTSSLGGEAAEASSSSRPDQRYFSGFASRIRKDSVADKQKDDSAASKPKKEKKTTLRGIRGFV